MKKTELKELNENELLLRLRENQEKLMKLRFQKITGHVANPMEKRILRREIARILSCISLKKAEV